MLSRLLALVSPSVPEVSAAALEAEMASVRPLLLLDIRATEQFTSGHLPGARHVPSGTLEAVSADLNPDEPVVVY